MRLLLPAPALLEQLTFGMVVCVHLGGCMGQHTSSPVRSLSCSLAGKRLAAAEVMGVAVGVSRWKSVETTGWLVCGVSLLLLRLLLLMPMSSRLGQLTCGMAVGVHFVWCMHIPGVSGKVVVLLGCGVDVGGSGGGSDGDGGSLCACCSVRSRGRW